MGIRKSTAPPSLKDRVLGLVLPLALVIFAIRGHIHTILTILFQERAPIKLFNISEVRDRAFGWLWLNYGEMLSEEMPPELDEYLKKVRGSVLDIGPGSGEQVHRFNAHNITRAYGAEPCLHLHTKLLAKAREAGFSEDKYVALGCGAEQQSLIPALAKAGLLGGGNGSAPFDAVVCVRVLCGVPRPRETIAGLYRLLKPGGRLVYYEHIRSGSGKKGAGDALGATVQKLYTLMGWRYLMGGCELSRETVEYIREAAGGDGGWEAEETLILNDWAPLPFGLGVFVKKE